MATAVMRYDKTGKRSVVAQPTTLLAAIDSLDKIFGFDGVINLPNEIGSYELVVTLFEPPDNFDPRDRYDTRLGTAFAVWRCTIAIEND